MCMHVYVYKYVVLVSRFPLACVSSNRVSSILSGSWKFLVSFGLKIGVVGIILAPSWGCWGSFWLQVGCREGHVGSPLEVLGKLCAPDECVLTEQQSSFRFVKNRRLRVRIVQEKFEVHDPSWVGFRQSAS